MMIFDWTPQTWEQRLERRLTADQGDKGGTGGGPLGTGPGSEGSQGQAGTPYGKGQAGASDIGGVASDIGGNSAGVTGPDTPGGEAKGGDTTGGHGGTPTTFRGTTGTEVIDTSEPHDTSSTMTGDWQKTERKK